MWVSHNIIIKSSKILLKILLPFKNFDKRKNCLGIRKVYFLKLYLNKYLLIQNLTEWKKKKK